MENKCFDSEEAHRLIFQSLEPDADIDFETAWEMAESMMKGVDEDVCVMKPIPEPEPWGIKGTKASI